MKILFVTSQNSSNFVVSPFIANQAKSIRNLGHQVDFFNVNINKGKNLFSNYKKLKKIKNNYDIIHAHYSTNGMLAILAGCQKKLVSSFLGSDLLGIRVGKTKKTRISFVIETISRFVVAKSKAIIVKTNEMKQQIGSKYHNKTHVIPNGVDFNVFSPMEVSKAKTELNLDPQKRYLLFLGNKNDLNKNFALVEKAYSFMNSKDIELITPYPISHELIPKYLNAADLLILTSYSEGSANVIKEALACNLPIVSVDVGDVKENLCEVENSEIVNYNPLEIAKAVNSILSKNKRSNGRNVISHLEIMEIAKSIEKIYTNIAYGKN